MTRRPTGSKLELWCPVAWVLPWVEREHPEAAEGTRRHRLASGEILPETEADHEWLERYNAACERWPMGGEGPVMKEIVLAYNVVSGEAEILRDVAGRDYPDCGSEWLFMTADGVRTGEVMVVRDLKTGRVPVPPPARNRQLLAAGLVLAQTQTLISAYVRLELLTVPAEGAPRYQVAEVSLGDLYGFADDLADFWTAIEKAEADRTEGRDLDVRRGQWCKYCPAQLSCPAMTAAAATLAEVSDVSDLSVVQLGKLYRLTRGLHDMTGRVLNLVHERAAHGPIDIGGGLELREVIEPGRREVDSEAAAGLLADRYGDDAVAECWAPRVTIGDIKRIARAHASGTKIAEERAVFAALKEIDAVRSTTRTAIKEVPHGGDESE